MEAILTLGIIGLIVLFFRKILFFIVNAILIIIVGSILALFTKATLTTGIFTSLCVILLSNTAYKSLFKLCGKLLNRSKRYANGTLENTVDILFSINISVLSLIWCIVIVRTGMKYDFDMSFLLEASMYAVLSVKGLSILEKVMIKKLD